MLRSDCTPFDIALVSESIPLLVSFVISASSVKRSAMAAHLSVSGNDAIPPPVEEVATGVRIGVFISEQRDRAAQCR